MRYLRILKWKAKHRQRRALNNAFTRQAIEREIYEWTRIVCCIPKLFGASRRIVRAFRHADLFSYASTFFHLRVLQLACFIGFSAQYMGGAIQQTPNAMLRYTRVQEETFQPPSHAFELRHPSRLHLSHGLGSSESHIESGSPYESLLAAAYLWLIWLFYKQEFFYIVFHPLTYLSTRLYKINLARNKPAASGIGSCGWTCMYYSAILSI